MTQPGDPPLSHARRRLALFDLDRTLIRRDTASLYMQHQRSQRRVRLRDTARVAYWLLQYTFGVVDAQRVAAQAMASMAGRSEASLERIMREVYVLYGRQLVSPLARAAVRRHQAAGDWVAIVTGATRYSAEPLATELGIDHLICTRVEVAEGRFTGRVVEPMCYGPGKVVLAEQEAARRGLSLDDAAFYTDSITDLPLLERVSTQVAVNPDPRLRRLASQRGWRIEQW
ncbi:MAG: HAD family hydrolase [Polyangiaceae bacterium]|nr:HAD family hydrolase [Polyangiaceae bacterium]MCW5790722.1 HAD family hydrolase [Polyangiaceae bacterium]